MGRFFISGADPAVRCIFCFFTNVQQYKNARFQPDMIISNQQQKDAASIRAKGLGLPDAALRIEAASFLRHGEAKAQPGQKR